MKMGEDHSPEGGRVARVVVGVVVRVSAATGRTLLRELEFRIVGVVRRAVVGGDCRDVRGDQADGQVRCKPRCIFGVRGKHQSVWKL